jgi:trehalose-6-phosphate synthase
MTVERMDGRMVKVQAMPISIPYSKFEAMARQSIT